jgi:hypothetical protein
VQIIVLIVFCYVFFFPLAIISSKYILNNVGKRDQPWRIPLLIILASFDNLELNFIDSLFCMFMSTVAFNNASGIFLDFRIWNKISLYTAKRFILIYKQQMCFQIIFPSFSINNLRQNVGSVHERPFRNPFCASVMNFSEKSKAVPLHAMQALVGRGVHSFNSFMTSALDGSMWSASCSRRVLPPGKGTLVPIVQDAGLAPEPVWTQRLEEKFYAFAGDRTPIARSSSPYSDTMLTRLARLVNCSE